MSIHGVYANAGVRISGITAAIMILLGVLFSSAVGAQSEASVSGIISDSSGAVLAVASVPIQKAETGVEGRV